MSQHAVTVSEHISAPVDRVWRLVSDIAILPQFSDELQSVTWLDGDAPRLGARFTGTNANSRMGEWTTQSEIVVFDPPQTFAWAVGDRDMPLATWRFDISDTGAGAVLNYTACTGAGRSGLTMAIERHPDRRDAIIAARMRQWEASMSATVNGIKALAEA